MTCKSKYYSLFILDIDVPLFLKSAFNDYNVFPDSVLFWLTSY